MKHVTKLSALLIVAVLFAGILSACSANTPTAAEVPAQTANPAPVDEMTTEPSEEPTAEPQPTLAPTVETSPTPLPELKVEGFNAWCIPARYGIMPEVSSSVMPEYGRAAVAKGDVLTVLYPDSICAFIFTFNQPAPQGLSLNWLYTTGAETPWLEVPLRADPQNGAIAFGTATHSYVVSPPLWGIDYRLQLKAGDGTSLWENTIHMERDWQPELCWNGVLPNPVTLLCIKQQDLHPWDPGYCMFNTCP
jgi:hypothetical protein